MGLEEWRGFLGSGPRIGYLATTRPDGRPHVVPIWFDLDEDGSVVFTTGMDSIKATNLSRDPRACLCVDDSTPPYAYVQVNGAVEVIERPQNLLYWTTRMARRYVGEELADEYGRRNAALDDLLVRLRPTTVVALKGIAD